MRYTALLVLTMLCSAYAVDDLLGVPLKLTPDAQRLVDKAEADCAKIEAKAHDDQTKVRVALVQALYKIQEAETKKGDLDDALVIKEEVTRQDKVITALAPVKAVVMAATISPTEFLGKWQLDHDNPIITISEKGVEYKSTGQTLIGTMSIDKKTGALHITWNSGGNVIFTLKGTDTATYGEASADWTLIKEKTCTKIH